MYGNKQTDRQTIRCTSVKKFHSVVKLTIVLSDEAAALSEHTKNAKNVVFHLKRLERLIHLSLSSDLLQIAMESA